MALRKCDEELVNARGGEAATREDMVRLADGHDRFVTRTGDGQGVLVCLHGGPGADHRSLLPVRMIADERLQVILYDQLGSGRSSRPPGDEHWTMEGFVAEFGQLVD